MEELSSRLDRAVYGMIISGHYHQSLIPHLDEVQNKTNTRILLPRHRSYSDYNLPVNDKDVSNTDVSDIVKVIGTKDAFYKAYDSLRVSTDVSIASFSCNSSLHSYIETCRFNQKKHMHHTSTV